MLMVRWADLHPGDRVLEPSAGGGAIARWFPYNTDNYVCELDPYNKLIPKLKILIHKENIIKKDFLKYQPCHDFDAIIMNPPYGKQSKIAI